MQEEQPLGSVVHRDRVVVPERVTLDGQYVTVAPLSALHHTDSLWTRTSGEEKAGLWSYLGEGPFPSRESFQDLLRKREGSLDPLFFALLDPRSWEALGMAALMRMEPAHGVIEVGNILYSPQLQKSRAATEAMYLLAGYVFDSLHYRRYEWKCNALNKPSRKAALRLGFTFEGIFRQHMVVKGRNRDTAWFSMLDGEWPARKADLERWLDASNFDENGRQKSSLGNLER